MILYHTPLNPTWTWSLHAWELAWDGNAVWDTSGTVSDATIDFPFPQAGDLRRLLFKFRSTSPQTGESLWESDDFVRQIVDPAVGEIWTFTDSPRILTRAPTADGVSFRAGDRLTVRLITRSRFAGGQIYAWNPYVARSPSALFSETARDEAATVSTFTITLADWMTQGFHFKVKGRDGDGRDIWETDASNRVWRPSDGDSIWIKSGQCDVRDSALTLTPTEVEVLIPATLSAAPTLMLEDVAEQLQLPTNATQVVPYDGSPLFRVARYNPSIYPQARYNIAVAAGSDEAAPLVRPFPAVPTDLETTSRFVLGARAWIEAFPTLSTASIELTPQPQSSLPDTFSVQLYVGNSTAPYDEEVAEKGEQDTWTSRFSVIEGTTTCIRLSLHAGSEKKPYDWIDTGRYFVANGGSSYLTTEGVFGISRRGPTRFAEPPLSRIELMRAVFGAQITSAGIFGATEMPHGCVIVGDDVYFVVHAPHAVSSVLVLVRQDPGAPSTRDEIPMSLTGDTFYWWCKVSTSQAASGTRYRFILNDDLEVLDPAAREVLDTGSFDVTYQADPNDPTTAWSLVLDTTEIRRAAHGPPWTTMGWQNLLIYEIHAARFCNGPAGVAPLDVLVDQLQARTQTGDVGYLRNLPVTALQLLPVQEFNSSISWGYDPSFYFAIDGHYGGSAALARLVAAAHATGRAVLLDVVYNHSLGSSLMKIASDVYRNGDYDGDRMNVGHPMVGQFLRQATLHLCYTFGIDGFRFDDTRTMAGCPGGWEFMGMIRAATRAAASSANQPWPLCIAENTATQPWDISDPGFGVMDGQWDIDEVYRLRDASYDLWSPTADDADPVRREMNSPAYWGRPFHQAVRFGESHDMVSEQDAGNKRIAARPPFGCGLQLAKALGTLTLLSNGVPMVFMGQEVGEVAPFAFDSSAPALNPQKYLQPPGVVGNTRVLSWFAQLMGLRNDPSQGLQGDSNYQAAGTGRRTVAFSCGAQGSIFVVVTLGTPDQQQDSSWLGLPSDRVYKEIFNSSWPVFQVESEPERTNGGYVAQIRSGQILNLPAIGAVVLQQV